MRPAPTLVDRAWQLALWVVYRLALVVWFVTRPKSRGAVVAVWHDGRLLLVRNSYRRWDALPAGGVKRGEDDAEAAARELREEVGIVARPEELRPFGEIPSRCEFKRDVCVFFELELDAAPALRVDRREVVAAEFATVEEALAADLAPPVRAYLDQRADRRTD